MTLLADLLPFLTVFCAGIATGTWIVTEHALIPARRELPAQPSVQLHVLTSARIDQYNPVLTFLSIVSGALVVALGLAPTANARLLTVIGLVAMLGAAATSLTWNMPMNRIVASWPAGSAPAEYNEILRKWAAGNLVRTTCGVVGFASYVLALTFGR
jgi:uncharacterized membrane protein